MIILDPLSKTLAWITGMIILCHGQKVLIGLKISSSGIKTTRALETSKQLLIVFSYSLFIHFVWMMSRLFEKNKSVGGEIPIQISKESEFTFETLTNFINKSIETAYFPDRLKEANITPIFKKR